jgi:hypothetical protein
MVNLPHRVVLRTGFFRISGTVSIFSRQRAFANDYFKWLSSSSAVTSAPLRNDTNATDTSPQDRICAPDPGGPKHAPVWRRKRPIQPL